MIYAITANSKKLSSKTIMSYLKKFHREYFPLIDEDKILKQVTPEFFLLRVNDANTPGDILGYITQKEVLSERDIFFCIPINEEYMERISVRTKNSLYYIHDDSLKDLLESDKKYLNLDWNIRHGVYFLANYLKVIEEDQVESNRKPDLDGYILTDRFSQYKTEDKQQVEVWTGNRQRPRIVEKHLIYSRFDYDSLKNIKDDWSINYIYEAANLLGFKIMYRINDEILESVNKRIFNNNTDLIEVIFIGKSEWRDNLGFSIDTDSYNSLLREGKDEYAIGRKPINHQLG